MPTSLLSEARYVWVALLRSGTPCDQSRWRDWADAQILRAQESPPAWIIDLSLASTHQEALQAVATDLGLEELSPLDLEALLIGFVADRYFKGEIPLDVMW